MKNLKFGTFYAVASAAAIGITACAGENAGPGSMLAPTSASRHAVGDAATSTPQVGHVVICKSAESNVAGTFTVTRTPFGTESSGQVMDPITVEPGQCRVAATDASPSGSASDIVVNETSEGFVSATYAGTDEGEAGTYANNSTSLRINSFHGYVVTYTNFVHEDEGCTYTQGWYKNPKHEWPEGVYDQNSTFAARLTGTFEEILDTPVKGNKDISLAHQYIAALLNVQGGASVPSDVQAALDKAEDYFAGENVDVSGVTTILDEFNNGIRGPGHCDDEEVVS